MGAAELEALAEGHDDGPLRLPLWRAAARAARVAGDGDRLRRALEALPADDPEAERARAALSPTRLGVLLPLSGRSAPIGKQLEAALDVLAGRRGEDHPEGPAGPTLTVRDAGTAPAAVAALRAMKREDVTAAIGVFDHTVAAEAAAAARAEGLPLIMLTLSDAAVEGDAGTWRALHTPKLVGRTAAALLVDRGATRAVVLRPEGAYGEAHGAWFRAAWRGAGRRALDEVTWAPGKADWGRLAKRVAGLSPDAIFLPAAPADVAQAVRHLAAAGVWVRGKTKRFAREKGVHEVWLVGTPEWYDPRLAEAGARYLEGALVPVPWAAELRQGAPLAQQVQAAAGRRATAFDAVLADALHAATVAHRAGRPLEAVRYDEGATAGLDFGQRDALTALFVVEVGGGGFRPAE
ncbi:MAG: penicillin-binding protein activator [Myxococcales bacterium]|nr:penicillin-binding protein activator [Myxococcales bacterium]